MGHLAKVIHGNQTIFYTVKTSDRAKHVRISIGCDGVVVTQPVGVLFENIEALVQRKINWIVKKVDFVNNLGPRRGSTREEYMRTRDEALSLVCSRIEHFNTLYRYTFQNISIRNQRTRWGSCSRRGNLNFNYRIIHLPPELVDYIIVHELCHLAELNHSTRFWKLVERHIPRHNELRRELKKYRL
ncbi:MAG: M48 family metallopeptidase [Candidatus Uhrbacteria bacterium]|nr:M48 family metallopeptidase [Candidatus Uhrbacteria bacterium]